MFLNLKNRNRKLIFVKKAIGELNHFLAFLLISWQTKSNNNKHNNSIAIAISMVTAAILQRL